MTQLQIDAVRSTGARLWTRLTDGVTPLLIRAGVAFAAGGLGFLVMRANGVPEADANQSALLITVAILIAQYLFELEEPVSPADRKLRTGATYARVAGLWGRRQSILAALSDRAVTALQDRTLAPPKTGVRADRDDREWILSLTSAARREIVSASSPSIEDTVWAADFRGRHLTLLGEAVSRGVRVRRVIVLEGDQAATDPAIRQLRDVQLQQGIEVRVLPADRLTGGQRPGRRDSLLFDSRVCCEIEPAGPRPGGRPAPAGVEILLSTREADVASGRDAFERLWGLAAPDDA